MKKFLFSLLALFISFNIFSQNLKGKYQYYEPLEPNYKYHGTIHTIEFLENQRFTYIIYPHMIVTHVYKGTWKKKDYFVYFTPDPVKHEDTAIVPPKIAVIKKIKRKDLENTTKKAFLFYEIYSNSADNIIDTSIAWGVTITTKKNFYVANDEPFILDDIKSTDSIKIKSIDVDLTFNVFKEIPDIEDYQEFHIYTRVHMTVYDRTHYEKIPFDKVLLLTIPHKYLFVNKDKIFTKIPDE